MIELHHYFRETGRVPPEKIATAARQLDNGETTVSRETVRRLLIGQTLSNWARVELVLRTMCLLANQDPDRRRWAPPEDQYDDDDPSTCIEHLRSLWNNAVDDIDLGDDVDQAPLPRLAPVPQASPPPTQRAGWGAISNPPLNDPWATGQPQNSDSRYSDEPPF
ncbi:hypothetical protein [Streptomyces sp. NPDC056045]|uniref:hypothetical protein n=1 Tax=Streptomyces sp. NPDC056045 TaxID=3345691 RepID=UPI0035D9C42E